MVGCSKKYKNILMQYLNGPLLDIILNHLRFVELKIYDLQNLDIKAATTRRNDIKEKSLEASRILYCVQK